LFHSVWREVEMEMESGSTSLRVIRMGDARGKVGLCPSKIYDLIDQGLFPRPFQLVPGGRAVGWLEADLDEWLRERKRASAQPLLQSAEEVVTGDEAEAA
jgi:prophage regulatory protein